MMARRMWSILALALVLGAIVLAVVIAVGAFPRGLTVLACGLLAVWAAWWALLRRGALRAVGLGAAVLLLCVAILRVIMEARVIEDLLVLAGIAGALAAARKAFEPKAELPAPPGRPDPSSSTTRFPVAGRRSASTWPRKPAGAASSRSSFTAAMTSSNSSRRSRARRRCACHGRRGRLAGDRRR